MGWSLNWKWVSCCVEACMKLELNQSCALLFFARRTLSFLSFSTTKGDIIYYYGNKGDPEPSFLNPGGLYHKTVGIVVYLKAVLCACCVVILPWKGNLMSTRNSHAMLWWTWRLKKHLEGVLNPQLAWGPIWPSVFGEGAEKSCVGLSASYASP